MVRYDVNKSTQKKSEKQDKQDNRVKRPLIGKEKYNEFRAILAKAGGFSELSKTTKPKMAIKLAKEVLKGQGSDKHWLFNNKDMNTLCNDIKHFRSTSTQ